MGVNNLMARLRVYEPNGPLRGSLPHPLSWEMGVPLNDMPSLTLVYPKNSPSVEALMTPCEVAVEIRGPGDEYQEHPGCRFLNLRRAHDMIERPGTLAFTMPSYGWQLRKVRFMEIEEANRNGRVAIDNATPGFLLNKLFTEAKNRGNIPGFLTSFTGTQDSAGQNWPTTLSGQYYIGQDSWQVLDTLSRQGLVDWRINGRTLDLFVPDTELDRNLSGDSGVVLHTRADTLAEPVEHTREELAQKLLVVGDERVAVRLENVAAETPWGNWEEILSAGGIQDTGTLTLLGQPALDSRGQPRIQITKEVVWREGSPVPLASYRPGDTIRASTEGNTSQPEGVQQGAALRIRQITLSATDPYNTAVNLILNDRFTERALRNERWLNRVTGQGGPSEGGGTGADPLPPEPDPPEPGDTRRPALPENIVVSAYPYFSPDTGQPVAMAEVEFDVVTEDDEGEVLEVAAYSVAAQRTDEAWNQRIENNVAQPEPLESRVRGTVGPLDGGFFDGNPAQPITYNIRIRTISFSGAYAETWTAPIQIEIPLPREPMPKLSLPITSSRLGTVKVEWDGLSDAGALMPPQFREVQVEMSLTPTGPWERMGEIFFGGSAVIVTGQNSQLNWGIGDTLYFRFQGRDSAGWLDPDTVSDVASEVVQGIEGPDLEANTITANEIAAGTITSEEIRAYSLQADRLSIGSQDNIVADPLFWNADLSQHRIMAASDPSNTNPLITWASSPTFNGFWARANQAIGPTTASGRLALVDNVLHFPLSLGSTASTVDSPGLLSQMTRPAQGGGNLIARFEFGLDQGDSPWGGEASADVTIFARFFDASGASTPSGTILSVVSVQNFTQPVGPTVIQSQPNGGAEIPADAVGVFVYARVRFTNVPNEATAWIRAFEAWQESSVYIGDGMITAPLIRANTITGDKMAADVIMANKSITGPVLRTDQPSVAPRVEISNNANYFGQPGIRFWGTASGPLSGSMFINGDSLIDGWRPHTFAIAGPKLDPAPDFPRPDLSLEPDRRIELTRRFEANATILGIRSGSASGAGQNAIVINGSAPRGDQLNDSFAVTRYTTWGSFSLAGGASQTFSWIWGTDNGWAYRPVITVRATNASATAGPIVVAVTATTSSGYSLRAWNLGSSSANYQLFIAAFRGGYLNN